MRKVITIATAIAAGFIAGVLLAPKSGKETREDIKVKARQAKSYVGKKSGQLKVVAHEAGDTLKTSAGHLRTEAKGMTKSARGSAQRVTNAASREAADLKKEAKARSGRVASEAKRTASRLQKDAEKRLK